MKLGVVAALETELKPTLSALHAHPFVFTVSGIGIRNAERAALGLSEDVQGILSVGFCGALDDTLSPGELLLGGAVGFDPSPDLLTLAQRTGPHRTGTFNTTDHV